MAYKHGIYTSEQATSLVPMTETDSGLIVVFGTAPLHLASEPAKVNTPVLCHTYKDAVASLGYSDDWEKYTLCEAMKSQFACFNMSPIVFVNVLDPEKHKQIVDIYEVSVASQKAGINEPVLLDTLKVYKSNGTSELLAAGTDYVAAYDDDGQLLITIVNSEYEELDKIYVSYTKLDPAAVKSTDIIGGVNTSDNSVGGLELIDEIYPRFGLVPGIIIAPKFSTNGGVMAIMKAKTLNISGHFNAIAIGDIPTSEVKSYTAASEWKNKNNIVDKNLIACWPMIELDGVKYHLSTQLASLMNLTDSQHGDIPYYSPSNKNLQADKAVLKDGTEVYLNNSQNNYLNGQGIVTASNFAGGWKAWGNRTTAYPSNTDVKDSFINNRRMFNWIGNTLVTTFWSKIDEPSNRRLIETIVDSANIWLNGLGAKGAILGGRVEFREDENTTTDLMDGKLAFHVYITPPPPARDIEFVQEYDPGYISTLFG